MIPKTTLKATHLSLRLRPALRRHVIVQSIRSKTTSSSRPLSSRRGFRYASYAGGLSIGLITGSIGVALWREDRLRAEATAKGTRPPTPLRELVRTYVVYSLCSIPALVDASPKILSTLMNVPVVNKIAEAVVRVTFFDQFVGADTAPETLPLLHRLRAENKGCLFAYSVEVDEDEASARPAVPSATPGAGSLLPHKLAVQEMIQCIDAAADFEDALAQDDVDARKTWVAIKLTALLPDAATLVRLSRELVASHASSPLINTGIPFPDAPHPSDLAMISSHSSSSPSSAPVTSTSSLTPDDLKALQELHADLFVIAERAEQRHVKLIMDAEYSWYQPAVDAYVLALMMRFNRLPGRTSSSSALTTSTSSQSQSTAQPLIYQTYQAYLRRTPAYLAQSLDYAKEHGFALGAKLVRGAYHPHEMAAHASRIGSPDTNADKDNGEQGVVAQSKSRSRSQSISPDELPPVWATKAETDASYDHCVKMLLDAVAVDVNGSNSHSKASSGSSSWWSRLFGSDSGSSSSSRTLTGTSTVPSVAVLFGTHNYASCGLVLSALAERGLAHAEPATASGVSAPDSSASGSLDSTALPSLNAPSSTSSFASEAEELKHTSALQPKVLTIPPAVSARVAFGQLYGMHDALTNALVDGTRASSPVVLKYVPYGGLREVMPYLSRRAIENRSVLFDGAAAAERRAAGREIWRRIVG